MEKMTKRDVTKKIVGVVVRYGSGVIVYGAIGAIVRPTRIDLKIGVAAASFALSGVVAEAAANYTDNLIDDIFDAIEGIKTEAATA